jgi:hypothetical protein
MTDPNVLQAAVELFLGKTLGPADLVVNSLIEFEKDYARAIKASKAYRRLLATPGKIGPFEKVKRVLSRSVFCRQNYSVPYRNIIAVKHSDTTALTAEALLAEMVQISIEFANFGVKNSSSRKYIFADTPPITLKGVELGSFQLRISKGRCLSAHAITPNKAVYGNELIRNLTHPHVCDNKVCLGEAQSLVHRALNDLRLADVFQLAHSVLTTYSAVSAYRKLDHWTTAIRHCFNCGSTHYNSTEKQCTDCLRFPCLQCITDIKGCIECRRITCFTCGGWQTCSVCQCRICLTCSKSFTPTKICQNCLQKPPTKPRRRKAAVPVA